MTAFDAHLGPPAGDSAWRHAAAIITDRPGVLVATVVAAAMVVCLAFCALVVGQEMRFHASRAVDDLEASLYLNPRTSRAEAEALKQQLDALPFVRGSTLRTKEAAIVALETNGLPANNRSNPLPDVWIVGLGLDAPQDGTSLTDRASAARRSLAQLPGVETVDVDTEWLATLERWQALHASGSRVAFAVLFPVVWVILGCLFFLAGGAFREASLQGARVGGAVIVGTLVGLGTLVTSVALLAVATFGVQSIGVAWKPIAVRVGQMSVTPAVGVVIGIVVLAMAVIATTARRR